MLYHLVESGSIQRKEYYNLNRSSLFQSSLQGDLAEEQRESYEKFLHQGLAKLLQFYFPVQFEDYNNQVNLEILETKIEEPIISEGEATEKKITWEHRISLVWLIKWHCQRMQFSFNQQEDLATNLTKWIEQSFKINKFRLQQLEKNKWEAQAEGWNLLLWISAENSSSDQLEVKFDYQQQKEIDFCQIPKMNKQGNFLINGHSKVVIFQSVRAPGSYFFTGEKGIPYGEIIPAKGSWIRIFTDNLITKSKGNKSGIKLKFLNTGSTVDLAKILEEFSLPNKELIDLLGEEETIINSYQKEIEEEKAEEGGKKRRKFHFLFPENNSYFLLGELGRKRFDRQMNIFQRIKDQILAEDLLGRQGKLILAHDTVLNEKAIQILQQAIAKNDWKPVNFSAINSPLYLLKVKVPAFPEKTIHVLGTANGNEKKTHFDLADFLSFLSYFINLQYGLGQTDEEDKKDYLRNQTIRRVGDLLYNILDSRLGIFSKVIESKYIPNISQLKKADPTRFPKIQEFNKAIKNFFNSSTLVQLQNQNNPLGEISHIRKVSSLGLGGFTMTNVSLSIRNNNPSYYGLYDLVETPEGQKVGLVHNLTLNAKINQHGQLIAPYYQVKKGEVTPKIDFLSAEEVLDKHIAHPAIAINEKNQIEEALIIVRYQDKFIFVPKEQIDYIDSSFYHLNSVNSANIPFFQHNDSTRMLMAANMQKQAVVPLKGQAPLIASGVENFLLNNSSFSLKASEDGVVNYADGEKIIVNQDEYLLKQFSVTNTNNLLTSFPLVKKGQIVKKGQLIACGNYSENQELALGYNLRVAFMIWKGYNFEDSIIISQELIEKDILTSLFAKRYTIIRQKVKIEKDEKGKVKYQEEEFYARPELVHLDEKGIVRVGTEVQANDILVSKKTPYKSQETEKLLLNYILEGTDYAFRDSSFRLPREAEGGVITAIQRWQGKEITKRGSSSYGNNHLEILEIDVVQKRKLEVGDKITSPRFASKGVIGKIVPKADMPFDEDGNPVDMICNPLSIPSRMNIGQLIEALLGLVAHQSKTKLLVRPFNTPDWKTIAEILAENQIKNDGLIQLYDGATGLPFEQKTLVGYNFYAKLGHMVADKLHARPTGPYTLISQQPPKGRAYFGGQRLGEMEGYWALGAHGAVYNLLEMMGAKSDDLHLRRLMQSALIFGERKVSLQSNNSESFNLLLQYLRAIGFNLTALDYQGRKIDFYKQFSKISL